MSSSEQNTSETDQWMGERVDQEKSKNSPHWERELLEKLSSAALVEQRRARRWGIFFKSLLVLYVVFISVMAFRNTFFDSASTNTQDHTALVRLEGTIAAQNGVSAGTVMSGLNEAFESEHAKGVVLLINSPGGSPVQSGLIYDEMQRLQKKYPEKPLVAVVEDVCASGGYYVASAAKDIYVDKSSIVGSIGVIMGGFGFVDAMEKLGVERRVLTSGKNKALLDPFMTQNDEQTEHLKGMLDGVHKQFIDAVKNGRGDRLKIDDNTFSGLIWHGEDAVARGMADGFGSVESVARDVFEVSEIVDYSNKPHWVERFADRIGAKIWSMMRTDLFYSTIH